MFSRTVASLAAIAIATLATSVASATPAAIDHAKHAATAKKKRTARTTPQRHAPAKAAATTANAAPPAPAKAQHAAPGAPKGCQKQPVEVISGSEGESFPLTNCDGRAAMFAAERLGILARPGGTPKPSASLAVLARTKSPVLSPGVRRIDYGLVERIQKVADHFGKPGHKTRVILVSGYRPSSAGSYHATARAIDFRVDGVTNEALVAFCKTLNDTGCGYYPNSVFIHMDARDNGAGHVAWIDASGPGESARYVDQWPPADRAHHPHAHATGDTVAHLDHELPPLPADEHPAMAPSHDAADNAPALPSPAASERNEIAPQVQPREEPSPHVVTGEPHHTSTAGATHERSEERDHDVAPPEATHPHARTRAHAHGPSTTR